MVWKSKVGGVHCTFSIFYSINLTIIIQFLIGFSSKVKDSVTGGEEGLLCLRIRVRVFLDGV